MLLRAMLYCWGVWFDAWNIEVTNAPCIKANRWCGVASNGMAWLDLARHGMECNAAPCSLKRVVFVSSCPAARLSAGPSAQAHVCVYLRVRVCVYSCLSVYTEERLQVVSHLRLEFVSYIAVAMLYHELCKINSPSI